jgi:ribosomal protein S12 methylthiotransferase accessory factor
VIGSGRSGPVAPDEAAETSAPPIVLIDLREQPREPFAVRAADVQRWEFHDLLVATPPPPTAVMVAIFGRDEEQHTTWLAAWAQRVGVPLMTVAIDAVGARVGPLSMPGRVGCAHCAQQRIRAAAAMSDPALAPEATNDKIVACVEQLVAQDLAVACSDPLESRLLDHVLAVGAGEPTRHKVVPLASCPVCGGARALGEEGPHPDDDDDAPLAGWVDPVTGVIPALQVDQAEGSGLPAVVTAAPPHVVEDDGSLRALPAGWGKGITLEDALRSAVGEAVERYSASLPDPSRLVWARLGELDGEQLDPRDFPLYRPEQYARPEFPYVAYEDNVQHPCVRGRWLSGGEGDVWVPAVFAFLTLTLEPEQLFCQGSSNGLAASTEWDDAALRAVLELVERDALMASWLTGEPGVRLDLDSSLEPEFRPLVEQIEALGAFVELYLLPSVCGATALCLGFGDGVDWPGANVALAADLDPAEAIRKSLLELGQTGPYLRKLLRSGTLPVPKGEADVQTMLDHAAYYFPAERASAFASLRSGRRTVSFESAAAWDSERSLEACASHLAEAGVRVALVDVTSADVALSPFRVVRAVSPDLQPISYGYGCERVPVERIRARAESADRPAIHPIW